MTIENNDSFVEVSLKEVSKDDCFYDILNKLISHIQVSLINPGAVSGIGILRDGFLEAFVGSYAIQENGSGTTLGLFKNVEGVLTPITFPLPGEVRLIKGSGVGPFQPPAGWRVCTSSAILSAYAVGTSPNYEVAPCEYIGI